MQIKKDLLSHMETNHPEFRFVWVKQSTIYNFRRDHADGLYDFILFIKDSSRCVFCLEIATSYDPYWKGQVTCPIAKAADLKFLKYRTKILRAEQSWYIFGNSKKELSIALAEISGDLRLHTMDFFCRSSEELRSNQLLQYGLSLVRDWNPLEEDFRSRLETDWLSGHLKENPFWPTFQEVERQLTEFAADAGLPTDSIRGYTVDLLCNFKRPGWSWANSRL